MLCLIRGNARLRVLHILAAQSHHQVLDALTQQRVIGGIALLERCQAIRAVLLEVRSLGHKAVALGVVDRAHIRLGDSGNGAQHALFAASRAGAVAGHQRVVVGAHHKHVAQRRGL